MPMTVKEQVKRKFWFFDIKKTTQICIYKCLYKCIFMIVLVLHCNIDGMEGIM